MQTPVVALFGAEIVVVGVLLPEGSSETKRNIYSRRFRPAVQSSDGWIQDFHWGESASPGGAV